MFTHLGDGPSGTRQHARPMPDDGLTYLIGERCVKPSHLRARGTDRVFMHGRVWAYCPAGRHEPDHQLIPTGGVELRRLEMGQADSRAG